MLAYWPEFIIFATAHVFSLISPDPDFLMVLQSSLRYSRKIALWVSFGISCGEMIHVGYALLGIGLIIAKSIWAFTALKLLGSAYLIYLGIKHWIERTCGAFLLALGVKLGFSKFEPLMDIDING